MWFLKYRKLFCSLFTESGKEESDNQVVRVIDLESRVFCAQVILLWNSKWEIINIWILLILDLKQDDNIYKQSRIKQLVHMHVYTSKRITHEKLSHVVKNYTQVRMTERQIIYKPLEILQN